MMMLFICNSAYQKSGLCLITGRTLVSTVPTKYDRLKGQPASGSGQKIRLFTKETFTGARLQERGSRPDDSEDVEAGLHLFRKGSVLSGGTWFFSRFLLRFHPETLVCPSDGLNNFRRDGFKVLRCLGQV